MVNDVIWNDEEFGKVKMRVQDEEEIIEDNNKFHTLFLTGNLYLYDKNDKHQDFLNGQISYCFDLETDDLLSISITLFNKYPNKDSSMIQKLGNIHNPPMLSTISEVNT